jgi:tetratricopeptide (TPR) repeat protein
VQDAWFEAECFNALALIKSSTERYDEAIDAYKQAIHLAPDQIFAWNNLGNLCAKIGRNDEAMVAFRKALEGNQKDAIAWTGLANVHFKIGYVDDAIAAYRKAIQYMPSFAQPWCGLGDVYASIGRADEAMKAYHKAIDLNKQYITPWIRLGVLFNKQERHREAIKAYQRALAIDPKSSAIWNELGMTHVKAESLAEAEAAFSKAIELDRGYGWAYSNLAFTYMQRGEYKKTVSLLLRSIDLLEKDGDKAISWNRLATVYRCLNDYDNALAAYQTADKLDPGITGIKAEDLKNETPVQPEDAEITTDAVEPAADANVEAAAAQPEVEPEETSTESRITEPPAWLFKEEGSGQNVSQGEETRKVTPVSTPGAGVATPAGAATPTTAAALEASDAAKLTEQGNACFNAGNFEGAIEAYNQAILKDATFGVPYSNLALTYLTRGQFAEAILLYQKSIELLSSDQDRAIAWNGLGNAYRCINDYTNAVAAYQRAAELDPETGGIRDQADDFQTEAQPQNAQAWNERGEVFFKVGSFEKASEAFNKAIELEPESGLLYGNLAGTLAAQGMYQEAALLYQKSIDLLKDDKDKAAAWNRLGNVYRKLNDYNSAIEAYQKAVVLADEGVSLVTRARFSLLSNCSVEQ